MKKLMSPEKNAESGRMILGKYTFFMMPEFDLMHVVDWFTTVWKKVHGMIPVTR